MEYEIIGNNMQSLKITLKAGERIYSDSGMLVSKSQNITMTPRLVGGILGAIERKIVGATGMLTVFEAKNGSGNASVAGVFPGKVKVLDLKEGDVFLAESTAFLAAEDSVKFTLQPVGITTAMFGGAGFVLQKFVGPGIVFIHVTGDIIEYDLDGTEAMELDPGHLAGFDGTLSYKIKFVDNIRTAMFGGVGLFLATFNGKGRIITQSVSKYKLSAQIFQIGASQQPKKK